MTIQGARDELINMMECEDIPFYFVPILQKVVETIEMEIATVSDIENIRAEIIEECQYEHDSLYGLGLNRSLDIIDKHIKKRGGVSE